MGQQRMDGVKVAGVATGHFMVDLYQNTLPPLLPLLSARLDLSLAMCGVVMSVASLTGSLSQPLFGYASDRGIPNWVLIPCVAWIAIILSRVYWVTGVAALLVIAFLGGMGNGMYHPQGSVATAAVSGSRRGMGIALYATAGNLGYTLSPLFVLPIVALLRPPLANVALLVPAALGVGLMLIGRVHRIQPVTTDRRGVGAGQLRQFLLTAGGRSLLKLNLIVCCRSWALYSLIVFLPHEFLRRGYGELSSGLLLTGFLMAGTISGMFGGLVSDRWGRVRTLTVSTGLGAVLLMLGLLDWGWAALVLLLLGSAVLQSAFPVVVAYAQEISPGHMALASGIMMGFGWGVGGLGTILTGMIADRMAIIWALQITLVVLLPIAAWTRNWPETASVPIQLE